MTRCVNNKTDAPHQKEPRMNHKEQYTSGEIALAIGMPHPTLRSWDQRGVLNFLRDISDADNDIRRGQWARFTKSEALQIAVMYALTRAGIAPALAASAVEHAWRGPILDGTMRSQFLCVARAGEAYAFTIGPSPESIMLAANWVNGGEWRVKWLSEDFTAVSPAEPGVPANLTFLDMSQIRGRVSEELRKCE
ncbi:MAG: hypothetical protein NTY38_04530 [Acidobacteria bacterium]|nr:hypothetical protein [Acidobacteriota bacterium]